MVFTLREEGPEPNALQRVFSGTRDAKPDEEAMSQAILDAGGVHFTRLVIEVHRQNVIQTLDELEALRPGARKALSPLFSIEDDE